MSLNKKKRIGVLTAGGDCPGLNAVIRGVVKASIGQYQMDVVGIEDGYSGLIEKRIVPLDWKSVSGILTQGGTILGTSNRADPFRWPIPSKDNKMMFTDVSGDVADYVRELAIEELICIGGDGTMAIAQKLCQKGVRIIGVPKTIDNDIFGTDITFGFDSAVSVATEAIDKIHTTAMSHHRVMVIEVMGRYAGWLALEMSFSSLRFHTILMLSVSVSEGAAVGAVDSVLLLLRRGQSRRAGSRLSIELSKRVLIRFGWGESVTRSLRILRNEPGWRAGSQCWVIFSGEARPRPLTVF